MVLSEIFFLVSLVYTHFVLLLLFIHFFGLGGGGGALPKNHELSFFFLFQGMFLFITRALIPPFSFFLYAGSHNDLFLMQ